jgi:voltage-gated potassium channel
MANPTQEKVWKFLETPQGLAARFVQGFIIVLILLSAVSFGVEYWRPTSFETYADAWKILETLTVCVFIAEYLIRLWAAPSKKKCITNFYSIIDVVAILPFFFTASNLGFIRSTRLLRLLRTVRLMRVAKILRPFWKSDGINVSRIVQENIVKNLVLVVLLMTSHHSVIELLHSVPAENFGDILFAVSIIALAAMFGFFSLSYGDMNPFKTFERFMVHLTTTALLFPIGLTFLIIQEMLVMQLPQYPTLLVVTIWLVFGSVVLWDFWNVKRVANKIVAPAS